MNYPHRYLAGYGPIQPEPKPKVRLGGHGLVAIALFAVAGAILGFAVAFVYVGVNYLNLMGAEWHWLWE